MSFDIREVLREKESKLAAAEARIKQLEAEMRLYLPVIERAESMPSFWSLITAGLGISTANGYRAVLKGETEL